MVSKPQGMIPALPAMDLSWTLWWLVILTTVPFLDTNLSDHASFIIVE